MLFILSQQIKKIYIVNMPHSKNWEFWVNLIIAIIALVISILNLLFNLSLSKKERTEDALKDFATNIKEPFDRHNNDLNNEINRNRNKPSTTFVSPEARLSYQLNSASDYISSASIKVMSINNWSIKVFDGSLNQKILNKELPHLLHDLNIQLRPAANRLNKNPNCDISNYKKLMKNYVKDSKI